MRHLWIGFFSLLLGVSPSLARPLVLVEGGGPPLVTDLTKLAKRFVKAGWLEKDIHQLKYDHRQELAPVSREVREKFSQLAQSYPEVTQFDFVTHSMGHFVALHALLDGGLASRVHTFVGLAGVAFGQNAGAMAPVWIGPLARWLSPFKNAFLTEFYERHQAEWTKLHKCSFYSPQDKFVSRPYDAGAFPGGRNVSLDRVGHMEFVRSQTVFETVLAECPTLRPET